MLFFGSKERESLIFLVVKKRGSLNFWKQGRSRSRSSADCPVPFWPPISSHSTTCWVPAARHAACPPVPPPLLSHVTARYLPIYSACLHVTTCCLPGRGLASSTLSLCLMFLHATVFLIAHLLVQLLRRSRGLACLECSIFSTLPRSAVFLTARLLGAWG